MQTLLEKVEQGSIDQLEALDIALSLCCLIEDGLQLSHLDPERIGLDEDNNVNLIPGNHPVDCCYAAPDVILDGANPSSQSMHFSLGCLLFYMLNKRNYYDAYDLDPIELADTRPADSLVDPGRYTGRASDVICAFTAWDPASRSEGIVNLLRTLENVPAAVTLQYTFHGEMVHSEQVEIQEDIQDYRRDEIITNSAQMRYRILPGTKVRFRPGNHRVQVPVAAVSDSGVGHNGGNTATTQNVSEKPAWLMVTFPNQEDPSRLVALRILPLNEESRGKFLPVSLLAQTRYQFLAVRFDENGVLTEKKDLFRMDVPADLNRKRALMSIRYHVSPKGFSVVLCDQNRRPLSNDTHFRMD